MSNTSNNERRQPARGAKHPVRRLIAGTAVTGAALYGAADLGPKVVHNVQDRVHQGQEFDTYNQYHLFQTMQENGGFDAGKVVTYEVTSDENENPTTIAQHLHAKDVPSVALEISGQEGGDHNLHAGDSIVLPRDQLKNLGPAEAPAGSVIYPGSSTDK